MSGPSPVTVAGAAPDSHRLPYGTVPTAATVPAPEAGVNGTSRPGCGRFACRWGWVVGTVWRRVVVLGIALAAAALDLAALELRVVRPDGTPFGGARIQSPFLGR